MKVQKARFVLSAFSPKDFPRDALPQVAFVGRSNVGKSSMLNQLLGTKGLARISSSPGRTRSVNLFLVNDSWYCVDLPGYGYAKAAKKERQSWARLVDQYFEASLPGATITLLVDAKVGATPLDVEAIEYIRSFDTQPLVVATKIDRVPRSQRPKQLGAIRETLGLGDELIAFSAKTAEGVREVWKCTQARIQQQSRKPRPTK